jgi:polyisoprenoid-binding protein YceI
VLPVIGRFLRPSASSTDWAQFAVKFIVSHPAVTCAIPASSNPDHLADNMRAGVGRLPDQDERRRMVEAAGLRLGPRADDAFDWGARGRARCRREKRSHTLDMRRALALAFVTAVSRPAFADANSWRLDPAHSRLEVTVKPAGALHGFLHTHDFRPSQWQGTFQFDPRRPDGLRGSVVVQTSSLRDFQSSLSAADRAKVESQVRSSTVLDADHYPQAVITLYDLSDVRRRENGLQATLSCTLDLHGTRRRLEIPVSAEWTGRSLRATGRTTVRQSDFGMKAYHRLLGAVSVKDEVELAFDIVALPASPAPLGRRQADSLR